MNRILFKKLLRDLRARKGSLLALVIIVTVGIGVYVGMVAVYRDLVSSRDSYYRAQRLADFSVDLKRAPKWALDDVASLPNVREVRGRINIGVLIHLPGVDEPISGAAISLPEERSPVLNDVLLRAGCWFSNSSNKEVILNNSFAEANRLRPGSRIKVLLLDQQHELLVVGTAMSPEFVSLIPSSGGFVPDPARFGVIYLPEKFLQQSCDLDGAYNQIIGMAYDNSPVSLDNTLKLIEEKLDLFGVTNTTPVEDQASVRYIADEIRGIKISAHVMPSLFLVVAALALNILMGRLVAQQRSIIGALKAVGYGNGTIMSHYLCYGLVIGMAGGILGAAFGCWMQRALVKIYRQFFILPDIRARIYMDILWNGMIISIVFSLLGTLKGVWFASRLEPAIAMRPPAPEKGARILPERIPLFWNLLPFRWKMILRAIFRNPFRSSVSILASLISTALICATLCNVDALNYLMSYEFEKASREDYSITLRDPKGRRVSSEAASLPSVVHAELQLAVTCDLRNGARKKRIGVIGLIRNNFLYTPLDATGNPVIMPEEGLVFSRKLAEILEVNPGDSISLRSLIGERRRVTAPVVAVVDTYFGLSAYADIEYLSRLIGEEWTGNIIKANVDKKRNHDALFMALKEMPSVIGIAERTRSLTQLNETFGQTMGIMITLMVLFAGLIAFGSILNTALVSLSERQRESGMLRVLGYAPIQVTSIFAGESQLLNVIGIMAGLAAGIGLSHLIAYTYSTELYRFPAVVYPIRLVQSAILMLIFISLAQLIIYYMVEKLDWLEVMKVKE
ncbi:ABC transporter permease [Candidatus Sumerlaeota bacterium]|nr:ABC transporter permease [Candidatus Sumerlaeota bacterium]